MFSARRNPQIKCWTGPASPQWGRKTKVVIPLDLRYWMDVKIRTHLTHNFLQLHTCGIDLGRTCWRTCSRHNTHREDSPHPSTAPEWGPRDRKPDVPACSRRLPNQIQPAKWKNEWSLLVIYPMTTVLITCWRNQWSSGWASGLLVASNNGLKRLSSSCWKLLISLLER